MTRHVFNVKETIELSGRGLAVVADKRNDELPSWLALKIGDQIEFHSNDDNCLRTKVAGIEMINPWTPKIISVFCCQRAWPKLKFLLDVRSGFRSRV